MKKLILLILITLPFFLKAQTSVYHPFPDSNIVWRQEYSAQDNNCCCAVSIYVCLKRDHYQYFLHGDTIIGSHTYHKIYKTGGFQESVFGGTPTCPPGCSNWTIYYYSDEYSGGIRQDITQRKIFYVPPLSSQDTLLYNFNLNVGDTLPISWINPMNIVYVSSIDSILIGANYYKRFGLTYFSPTTDSTFLIEGIGSTYGLLSQIYDPMYEPNRLVCVTINNDQILMNYTRRRAAGYRSQNSFSCFSLCNTVYSFSIPCS